MKSDDKATVEPAAGPARALIAVTSAYTGQPLALAVELVGEVKAIGERIGGLVARTLIVHPANRRVHWRVVEPYSDILDALRAAGVAVVEAARRPVAASPPPGGPAGAVACSSEPGNDFS